MISYRRILSFALGALLSASLSLPGIARAEDPTPSPDTGAVTLVNGFDIGSIYEPYFILVDADNPTVSLDGLEREADLRIEPASTTKILTSIVTIEECAKEGKSLNDMAAVSAKAVDFGKGNSLMGLEEGDQFPIIDLLYGMMLPSGNDAAIAIAEHIAGSTSKFAELMNAKAAELGMTGSHFVTVHGKHNENHYSTVRDMAKLTAYALQNETFRRIVSTPTYTTTGGTRQLTVVNSNRLLIDTPPTEKLTNPISCLYAPAIGVKTGDTTQAGKCLVAAAQKEGITLIAVLFGGTLNDPTYDGFASDARKDKYNAYRFQDAISLFEFEFNKMERTVTLADLKTAGLQTEFPVEIPNAAAEDPNGGTLIARANLSDDFTLKLMEPKLRSILESASSLADPVISNSYAPISDGAVIGHVTYEYNGETLFGADLLATRSVKEGMAQLTTETTESQSPTGNLMGEVIHSGGETIKPSGGSCKAPDHLFLWILLPVLLLLLVGVIAMFAIAIRNQRIKEEKRRKRLAAKRRAAKKRAAEEAARRDREQY